MKSIFFKKKIYIYVCIRIISQSIFICLFLLIHSSGILNKGYKVSASHAAANVIKTDAPMNLIWDIMRSWVKLHPVTSKNIAENSPSKKILSIDPRFSLLLLLLLISYLFTCLYKKKKKC